MRNSARVLFLSFFLFHTAGQSAPAQVAAEVFANAPAPKDEKEVKSLIDKLTEVDSFDTGFSPSHAGSNFPPVAGQSSWSTGRTGSKAVHRASSTIENLVALGPHALPLLLDHLEDDRLSALTIKHEGFFGGMWHAQEVPAPRSSPKELATIAKHISDEEDLTSSIDNNIESYTLTVGDLCFVTIGMISNRSYNALRYQPTACQIINSPTTDPEIALAVRDLWSKDTPDLYTRLNNDFTSGDERLSLSAATRLLFYYPEESSQTIHDHLLIANANRDEDLSDLLNAVSWSPNPSFQRTIKGIVMDSSSASLIKAGVPAFSDSKDEKNLADLRALAKRLRKQAADWQRNGALVAVIKQALDTFPAQSEDTVQQFINGADTESLRSLCSALYTSESVPIPPLIPLLEDQHSGVGRYLILGEGAVKEPTQKDVLPHRICDNIYFLISRALGDLQCLCTGTAQEMDRKIATLQQRLTLPESDWKFSREEIVQRQSEQNAKANARTKRDEAMANAKTPALGASLVARDATATREEFDTAVVLLLSPAEIDEPYDGVDHLRLNWPRKIKALAKDQIPQAEQEAIAAILAQKIEQSLKQDAKQSLSASTLDLAFLASCWNSPALAPPLTQVLQTIPSDVGNDGSTEMNLDALFHLLQELIRTDFPRSQETTFKVFQKLSKARERDLDDYRGLYKILGTYWQKPQMGKILAEMFGDPNSQWALKNLGYAEFDDLGNYNFDDLPQVRLALREALQNKEETGQLFIKKDDPDYCWIEWSAGGSSGMGFKQPCQAKPGGPAVSIRRCDEILAGLTGGVFRNDKGPDFEIYWPLEKREEARLAWLNYLGEPAP